MRAARLILMLSLAVLAPLSLGQVTIHPTADAHVVDGTSANTNFGSSTKLQVQKSSTAGNNRISYLTFDISSLPATLQWVKVRLYVAPPGSASFVDIHAVTYPWLEPFITWNNKPFLFQQVGPSQTLLFGWREFDVTAYVQAQKAQGVSTVRFALSPTLNTPSMVEIHSKQNLLNKPELQYLAAPTEQVYFIHADHLNTPRAIYDANQQLRWKWDQQEAFGVNVPDENPFSLGAFEFNLRFPGQYFDKETNLHYNYFRDFDPQLGRYIESDPIGLLGGVNTYAYVAGAPLYRVDPFGLCDPDDLVCQAAVGQTQIPVLRSPCDQQCFETFFGISTVTAAGVALSGTPSVPKQFVTPGSSPSTSVASQAASKVFGQAQLPVRLPAPTAANPGAMTKSVARFAGRWVPIVGFGVLTYSFYDLGKCLNQCNPMFCAK